MDDEPNFLHLEEVVYELKELKAEFTQRLPSLPALIADAMPKSKELNINAKNSEKFDGKVVVTNSIESEVSNLNEVTAVLDQVIKAIEGSKTDFVSIRDTVEVKDIEKLADLLQKLNDKDTNIIVKAPDVTVNNPDELFVKNWPRNAKEPIAVRLSNGERFISQLTQAISGGGGRVTPYQTLDGEARFVNLETDGSIPVTVKSGGVGDIAQAQKITVVSTITYIAVASPGSAQSAAVWQVKKIDESVTGTTIITWADGDGLFNNVATDLTTLSYL